MSAVAKQHRKDLAEARFLAVQAERDRCAKVAEAFSQRTLDDGMIAHADAARQVAERIRSGSPA